MSEPNQDHKQSRNVKLKKNNLQPLYPLYVEMWHGMTDMMCLFVPFAIFFSFSLKNYRNTKNMCPFFVKNFTKKLKEKWISFLCIQRPRVSFTNVCIFKPFLKRSTSLFNEQEKWQADQMHKYKEAHTVILKLLEWILGKNASCLLSVARPPRILFSH